MPGIPHPVLLIHGFDGTPADWTGDGFPHYLVRQGGFDPELIRLFHFGLDEEGDYNNRGDIRQIASRLLGRETGLAVDEASSLACLSRDSVARGGPAQVDIVAHSLGGLVARYYLSRREPDEYGTVYQGDVGRLITLGTPHLGVDLTRVLGLIPPDPFVRRVMGWAERLFGWQTDPAEQLQEAEDAVHNWQQRARRDVFRQMGTLEVDRLNSPALRQIQPESAFLAALNAPGAMPADVRYCALYGDIRIRLRMGLGRLLPLYDRTVSLGDLLIPVGTASVIPNAPVRAYGFSYEQEIAISFGHSVNGLSSPLAELPPCYHGNLRRNPAIQVRVLHILTD
ncbi:MAG: alpha/beta fold hydrolase [Anaerolineae bacterium]|nr:alpha/beta fold hydrolase [Anaerolineae bacterium]